MWRVADCQRFVSRLCWKRSTERIIGGIGRWNIGQLQLGRLEASLRGGFAIRSAVANIQGTQLAEATKKPVRLGQTGRLLIEAVETGAGILLAIDRGAGDGDADHLHRPKSKSPASHRHGASRLPPCQYIRGQGIMEIIVTSDGDDFVNCKPRAPTTSGCSPEKELSLGPYRNVRGAAGLPFRSACHRPNLSGRKRRPEPPRRSRA